MYAHAIRAGFAGVMVILGLALAACGGGGDAEDATQPAPTVSDSSSVSSSMVAPDTFLTFEDSRYRLESLEQADLAGPEEEYVEAGTATEADIDQADLTVYRRADDAEAVYTYAAATGDGEEGTPALWYRWVLEP